MPEPLLEMTGISKSFGGTPVLQNVDFTAWAGEVHALVGENGAGKSTLMKVLSGACAPDAGHIMLDGEAFIPASPLHARRCGIEIEPDENRNGQDQGGKNAAHQVLPRGCSRAMPPILFVTES